MGYDDNTPLTGVTGGGLPAEIWRETMVRVHEGLPVRQLPARFPPERAIQSRDSSGGAGGGGGVGLLDSLIRDILGGGGSGTRPAQPQNER